MEANMPTESKNAAAERMPAIKVKENDSPSAGILQSYVASGIRDGTIKQHKFYFIMLNHDGKRDKLPSEIVLLEFTLQDGIRCEYSALIDLDNAENVKRFGYLYWKPKNKSVLKHMVQRDLRLVYDKICELIAPKTIAQKVTELRPIFTLESNISELESILNFLSTYDGAGEPSIIDVCSIEMLLRTLKNILPCEDQKFYSQLEIDKLFEKELQFTENLVCDFHYLPKRRQYCGRAYVLQWAYMFCELLCPRLNIDMKAGSHKPLQGRLKVRKPSTGSHDGSDSEESDNALDWHCSSAYVSAKDIASAARSAAKENTKRLRGKYSRQPLYTIENHPSDMSTSRPLSKRKTPRFNEQNKPEDLDSAEQAESKLHD